VIALWLGHENIQSTHGYIEADLATKEQVLEKVTPAGQNVTRFKADDSLLRFSVCQLGLGHFDALIWPTLEAKDLSGAGWSEPCAAAFAAR
jgi:hypothetical protein